MRRTTSLTAATLLGAALLTAPTAVAAGETCRGEAATIIGTGPTVQGTEGRDVIVTGTSVHIFAGAGDDLVCVTSAPSSVQIDTGDGDDVLDASATDFGTLSSLQTGRDRYIGGPGVDFVTVEDADDVVLGGAGSDNVTLMTAEPGAPVAGSYDGGPDDDKISVFNEVVDLDVELDEQVVVDGVPVASITGFNVASATAPRVVLRGSADANSLYVSGCDVRAYGGDGDDRIALYYEKTGAFPKSCGQEARLSGGLGDDNVYGWTVADKLVGNAGDDKLHGRGGADLLLGGSGEDKLFGDGGGDTLRGQRGGDTLIGDRGGDTLIGDRGRDTAGGGAGRDRCSTEIRRACESH